MRALGVDWGTVRIGIATTDDRCVMASPLTTIETGRDLPAAYLKVVKLAIEEEAGVIVIGDPITLDGFVGIAATAVRLHARQIAERVSVPVVVHDERLSTVTAHNLLAETGLDSRKRRKVVDRAAATVMLQDWIDRGQPMTPPD